MTNVNQLITEHLDVWTAALEKKSSAGRGNGGGISLHGVKKLRELILELAVRGKLVSQGPSDGAAEMLLSEYRHRRIRGIKEKRFKKQNLGEPLFENEKPFNVHPSWRWVRLGEIGFVFNGNSVSAQAKAEKYSSPKGLPFIATKNVGYGFEPLDYDVDVWIPTNEPKFKVAPAKTPLICSEGGSAGKKCGLTDRDVCFGNKLYACEFYGEFVPEFLLTWYQCPSFYALFSEKKTGIIGGISLAKFLRLPVPIPPIAEQRRIVTKVNELMALCDALEQNSQDAAQAHQILVETCLDTLTNSQSSEELTENWSRIEINFENLFTTVDSVNCLEESVLDLACRGKLVLNSQSTCSSSVLPSQDWITLPLFDLLEFGPKNGLSPRAVNFRTDVKVLTLTATTSGEFKDHEYKYVDIDTPETSSEFWLKKGDILIQRANALQYVGVSALYDGPDNEYIYPDLMIKIRPSKKKVLEGFLILAIQSRTVRDFFRQNATGTSGSMPKINQGVLSRVQIALPPLEQQKLIIDYTSEIKSYAQKLRAAVEKSSRTLVQLADTLTLKIH